MKKDIINSVVGTPRSQELVRKTIPILVGWAKRRATNKTYGDLISALGYTRYSGIGSILGNVELVLRKLRKVKGYKDVPTLNAQVKSSKTDIPSHGFEFVYDNYGKLSDIEKKIFIAGINESAYNYSKWDEVLHELGLKNAILLPQKQLDAIKNMQYGYGGEGIEHKTLKEYIYHHPKKLKLQNIVLKETEYTIPSGDRLDVFFELGDGTHVAIEVKPSSSPELDIIRGIFQCVKYQAVMEAFKKIGCRKTEIKVILLIARELSSQERLLAEELEISYIENFKM